MPGGRGGRHETLRDWRVRHARGVQRWKRSVRRGPRRGGDQRVHRVQRSHRRRRDDQFPDTATPAAIEPSCAKIKVGQTLTFAGDFAAHPLVPEGGDSPNPIPATSSGTNKIVSFPSAGTFGFGCSVHATMRGAILVVTQ